MIGSVFYKDTLAGEVRQNEDGDFIFEYSDKYIQDGQPAISYSIPTTQKVHTSRDIHGFFDGLLPEGWLLNLAATHWKLNPLRDRYLLLLKTTYDPIGAVSIREQNTPPPNNTPPINNTINEKVSPSSIGVCLYCYEKIDQGDYHPNCSKEIFGTTTPPLIDLDQAIFEELEKTSIAKSLTVPGVQRKISLTLTHQGDKGTRLTLANYAGRYILKPTGPIPHIPENEDLIMKLAKSYGIQTAPTSIVRLQDNSLAIISKRFDRDKKGLKFHSEDFCQILDQLTLKKYIGSIKKVGKHLRTYCQPNAPQEQALRLYELVLFSFIVGNSDLHLKNISVLSDPLPRLSPAYDLLSFDIYKEDFKEYDNEESALAINGKKNKLNKEDFNQLASELFIQEKVRDNIYKDFIKVNSRWKKIIDKSLLPDNKKNKLKELIDSRLALFN